MTAVITINSSTPGQLSLEVSTDSGVYTADMVWPEIGPWQESWVTTLMFGHAIRELIRRGAVCINLKTSALAMADYKLLEKILHVTCIQHGIAPLSVTLMYPEPPALDVRPTISREAIPSFMSLAYPAAAYHYNCQVLDSVSVKVGVPLNSENHYDTACFFSPHAKLRGMWHETGFGGTVPVKYAEASCWSLADWAKLLSHVYDINSTTLVVNGTAEASLPVRSDLAEFTLKESEMVSEDFLQNFTEVIETRDLTYYSSSLFADEVALLLTSYGLHLQHCSPSSYLALSTILDVLESNDVPLTVTSDVELVHYARIATQLSLTNLQLSWMVEDNPVSLSNRYVHRLLARMDSLDLFGSYASLMWSIDNPNPALRAGPLGGCLVLDLAVRSTMPARLRTAIEKASLAYLAPYQLRVLDTALSEMYSPFQLRLGPEHRPDAHITSSDEILDLSVPESLLHRGAYLNHGALLPHILPVFGLPLLAALRTGSGYSRNFVAAEGLGNLVCSATHGIPSYGLQVGAGINYLPLLAREDLPTPLRVNSSNYSDMAPFVNVATYSPLPAN